MASDMFLSTSGIGGVLWSKGPPDLNLPCMPQLQGLALQDLRKPAKSKRGREEGDRTENVINCRDVCRKLS